MAIALVLSTLIASIAYLIPRLLTLKVNMDQLSRLTELQSQLEFEGPDETETSASGGLYGNYV
jgi:hypothetical protein